MGTRGREGRSCDGLMELFVKEDICIIWLEIKCYDFKGYPIFINGYNHDGG